VEERTKPALKANLFVGLCCLFLASLPFHRPPVTRRFGPALAIPEVLFVLVALAAVLGWRRLRPVQTTGLQLAGVYVVLFGVTVPFAVDPKRAFAHLAVLVYVALIYQTALLMHSYDRGRAALKSLLAGSVVACVLGLAGFIAHPFGLDRFGWAATFPWMPVARPVGPTETPAMLGMIALVGVTAAVTLWRDGDLGRIPAMGSAGLFGVALLVGQSRVLLTALIGLSVGLLTTRPSRSGRIAGAALLFTSAALLVGSLCWRVIPISDRWPYLDTTRSPYRVCHEIAARMWLDHPVHGVGLENFHLKWPLYYDSARDDIAFGRSFERVPMDPHNTLLGYLAEAGLPGLLAMVLAGYLVWRRRGPSPLVAAFVAATLAATLFTDVFTERSTWACLGLLAARAPQPQPPETSERKGRG
jgi:hypothetical protein